MNAPAPIIDKVFAYITHDDRLLVFRHTEFPEAGIQVPAGTLEPGESPESGVLREAHEETGLENLHLRAFLGLRIIDWVAVGKIGIHRRHFFHLSLHGDAPETWRHYEMTPSDGSEGPIEFEFFWTQLPDGVPSLIGEHDALLPELIESMES